MTNTWDSANRLISTLNQNAAMINHYDGLGNRIGRTQDGVRIDYALDVAVGLPEVVYTSEGHKYLHVPGLIMTESDTGERRYLLSDGLGSVRHVVDEAGVVVAYKEYDPYGNPIGESEAGYGFTGEWFEDDIGLLHLRARWYDPGAGVFLSRDVVESEPAYQYVGGNPVNWVDPSGYCTPQPGETTCTDIIGETSSEYLWTNGGLIKETTFTIGMCPRSTETSLCYNLPSQQRPTLQPLNYALNLAGNTTLYPLSIAGATTKFVTQGAGLHGQIVYSRNSPPRVKITPRGTIRSYPSNLAKNSTILAGSIPIVIGVVNAGEIELKYNAGEISSSQAWQQHGVNFVATGAGAGGAWAIPAGANLATGVTAGAIGATEAPVLVPASVAFLGGACLAYDISIIQGTANRMIEGQPLWFAYLDAREETHQTMFFGLDPIR